MLDDAVRPVVDARRSCGDFNIAPDDRDVYDPAAFVGETHISQPERDALRRLEDWGLVDVFRQHYDAGGLFSWWDYRAGNFHKGKGMRIDLDPGHRVAGRPVDQRPDRPQRPQGQEPERPRAGHRRLRPRDAGS